MSLTLGIEPMNLLSTAAVVQEFRRMPQDHRGDHSDGCNFKIHSVFRGRFLHISFSIVYTFSYDRTFECVVRARGRGFAFPRASWRSEGCDTCRSNPFVQTVNKTCRARRLRPAVLSGEFLRTSRVLREPTDGWRSFGEPEVRLDRAKLKTKLHTRE